MNETVKEWVDKADADHRTAGRELHTTDLPNYDAVCFHAQQCIEKLMKALLIHVGVIPPKTHDLRELDRLLTPVCPGWSWPVEDFRFLNRAAVDFRYPGEAADLKEAALAFDLCGRMRDRLLSLIEAIPGNR
jgi:HEPN domain-containing protein